VIVPTHESAPTLEACLRSIRRQTVPSSLIVVDNESRDSTRDIASRWADQTLLIGPERSAQRNAGARATDAEVIGFIDSDMVLEPTVVEEAVSLVASGCVGVIVPEYTIGQGYWARVRAYERTFYQGSDSIEAARFFSRLALFQSGGFDESMTGAEDWDLTIRIRRLGRVSRTTARIAHDEGRVRYWAACRKKGYYASGVRRFQHKYGRGGLKIALDRPYLKRPWRLARDPLLGAGLIALKAGETAAMTAGMLRRSASP
jgi:glycosyltransferase involved in cell wall biosynthesis